MGVSPTSENDRRKAQESALLSLRIADISCGSGHILLAAARRIGMALAIVRTGDDQPSPTAYREAVRDVIKNCIYGVDLNPLAVELCKVALWLEAHVPGEPLGFLDHHIKCGNAIVGFVTRDELDKGIPDEAFKTLPGDDKDIAAAFRKTNKDERKERATGQKQLPLAPELQEKLDAVLARMRELSALPEHTPAEIAAKKQRYAATQSQDAYLLRQIAAIPIAQFYQPKTAGNKANLITDATFRHYLAGRAPQGQATASAWALAERKRAFHWFLEFPDIIANGGFDCILGNPPYLGGTRLSGTYGHPFCEYVRWQYAPTGLSDLVVFFLRRIYTLLRPNGFTAFITTNSIKDGDNRHDGLEQIIASGGNIAMALRGVKWPGIANLSVSLLSIFKGDWEKKTRILDGTNVTYISAFLESSEDEGNPLPLFGRDTLIYKGTDFMGEGFLLSMQEAKQWLADDPELTEVLLPAINGDEINSDPQQLPGRWIINFFDWPVDRASKFERPFERVSATVRLSRELQNDRGAKEKWWLHLRPRMEMYSRIRGKARCFVTAQTSKHFAFSAVPTDWVFLQTAYIYVSEKWSDYAVIQSSLHYSWVCKYSGSLETRMRYLPTQCFVNFAFPANKSLDVVLAEIGERYHEHRRDLMLRLWLGLTDIYNLFHAPDLDDRLAKLFHKRAKTGDWHHAENVPPEHRATAGTLTPDQARDAILELRALHRALDQAVLTAYAWHQPGPEGPAIDLAHDFQQVETLPENDRTRYTITPQARKALLTRLLKLNHQRAAGEQNATAVQAKTSSTRKTARQSVIQLPTDDLDLFRPAATQAAKRALPRIGRPTGIRPRLTDDNYFLMLIPHLATQSPDGVSLSRLIGALGILTDSATRRSTVKAANDDESAAWSKDHKQDHRFDSAAGALFSLLNDHTLSPKGGAFHVAATTKVVDSEWLAYDAHHVFRLADLLPAENVPSLMDKFVAETPGLAPLLDSVA